MILVDTSVWIDHFRRGNPRLATLLEAGEVLCLPDVLGEPSCGRLQRRALVLSLLESLPSVRPVSARACRRLVEDRQLWGRGLGWTDVRILAAAASSEAPLFTLDRALASAAASLRLS